MADFLKNTAPPGAVPLPSPQPKIIGSPSPRINGLRAHPPSPPSSKANSVDIRPSSPTSQRSSTKPKMYQARDARMASESIRDFADFIRSTGPPGSTQGPANPPSGSLRTHYRDASDSAVSGVRSETLQSNSSKVTAKPKETESPRKTGPRLQPRAAVAAAEGNTTSELIDFIREGPPVAGGHRIPRTVAPFRTTMDSDEFNSLDIARIENDSAAQTSAASTQDGSTQSDSLRSSVNSRAPLLESSNRSNDPAGPVRKQRRVRDPYAIESDDELDELPDTPKAKPPREEESLLDFLNSVPPPPGNDRPPEPFTINMRPPKSSGGFSTASAMRARFRRTTSVDKTPVPKPSLASIRSRKSNHSTSAAGVASSVPASPSVPGGASARPDANGPFDNNASRSSSYTVRVNRERAGGSASLPHGPAGGPRPPQRQTETSALADFLRNTGPPEPPPMRTSSSLSEERKDASGLSKLFRRGKKVEA